MVGVERDTFSLVGMEGRICAKISKNLREMAYKRPWHILTVCGQCLEVSWALLAHFRTPYACLSNVVSLTYRSTAYIAAVYF